MATTTGSSAPTQTTLDELIARVQACDVSGMDSERLRSTTTRVRQLERSLAGLTTRIGQRATELSSAGAGPDANEALRGSGEVSAKTARSEARRSKAAAKMPGIGSALSEGKTSAEHVDAVADALSGLSDNEAATFAEHEEELCADAKELPPEIFRKKAKAIAERAKGDHGRRTAKEQRAASQFKSWTDRNGMGHFRGSLDGERFAALVGAVNRQTASMANDSLGGPEPLRRDANLAAAALCELVAASNEGRRRTHLSLVVDHETATRGPHDQSVCETSDGHPINPDAANRLACDAIIQRVTLDEYGVPIDVGRKYRTATDAQWVALKAIYSTCAMCDRSVDWCQAHHIIEWAPTRHSPGGPTDLDNLIPLCSHCHHLVHEGGYRIKLLPDRTLEVHRSDGTAWQHLRPDRLPRRPPDRERRRHDN